MGCVYSGSCVHKLQQSGHLRNFWVTLVYIFAFLWKVSILIWLLAFSSMTSNAELSISHHALMQLCAYQLITFSQFPQYRGRVEEQRQQQFNRLNLCISPLNQQSINHQDPVKNVGMRKTVATVAFFFCKGRGVPLLVTSLET